MQQVRQQLHVALRAQDVVAGFRVARFGEVRERADADALRQVVLGHAVRDFGFERGVLVLQPVACHLRFELRVHAREYDGRHDRLGDVVGGTELEAAFLVAGVGQCGEEDDGDVARGRRILDACQH